MKALTLTQPYATLIAIQAKKIETRSWRTRYRGPLAIHAAIGFPKWAKEICRTAPFLEVLRAAGLKTVGESPELFTRGCVIATCELIDILPIEATGCLSGVFDDYPELDTPQERAFGDFSPGRWAWILDKVEYVNPVVPAKGALSLWEWERAA